jgi:hypothetical protein
VSRITVRAGRQFGLIAIALGALTCFNAYLQRDDRTLSMVLAIVGVVVALLGITSQLVRYSLVTIDDDAVRVYGLFAIFRRTFRIDPGDRVVMRDHQIWIEGANGSRKVPADRRMADREDWLRMCNELGAA